MTLWKATARGVGYPLAVLLAIVFLPITAAVAVATNYRGAAEQLADLPGVDPRGGLQSGVVVGGALLVVAVGTTALGAAAAGSVGGGGDGDSLYPTPTEDREPQTTENRDSFSSTPRFSTVENPANDTYEQITWFSSTYIDVLEENSKISVQNWEVENSILWFAYSEESPIEEEKLSHNISTVTGVYNSAVETLDGAKPDQLNVSVSDSSGSVIVEYYVKTSWSRSVANGEMNSSEQAELVSNTVEWAE